MHRDSDSESEEYSEDAPAIVKLSRPAVLSEPASVVMTKPVTYSLARAGTTKYHSTGSHFTCVLS